MTGLDHRTIARHGLLAVVVALALLVRGLVPAGWMPEARGGEVRVMLCSEHGAMTVPLDLGGTAPDEDRQSPPCPFALAGVPILGSPPPALAIASVSPREHQAILHERAVPAALAHHHPPARGPPARA